MTLDNRTETNFREELKQLSLEIRQFDRSEETTLRPVDKVMKAIQDCREMLAESHANGELSKWEEYLLAKAQAAVAADWLMAAISSIYKAMDIDKSTAQPA